MTPDEKRAALRSLSDRPGIMTGRQLVELRQLGSKREDDPQLSLFDVRPATKPAGCRQAEEQERWLDAHPGSRTYQAPQLRGYADAPGSGPANETCSTCAHHVTLHRKGQDHHRCFLMARVWGKTDRADIDQDARACRHWAHPGVALYSRDDSDTT